MKRSDVTGSPFEWILLRLQYNKVRGRVSYITLFSLGDVPLTAFYRLLTSVRRPLTPLYCTLAHFRRSLKPFVHPFTHAYASTLPSNAPVALYML